MNSGTTLYEEAVALRAEVREVQPLPAASAPMMARPEGARKIGCHIGADLDPVPHPCTTSPGPCRRSVLLKRFEVCRFAEHD